MFSYLISARVNFDLAAIVLRLCLTGYNSPFALFEIGAFAVVCSDSKLFYFLRLDIDIGVPFCQRLRLFCLRGSMLGRIFPILRDLHRYCHFVYI